MLFIFLFKNTGSPKYKYRIEKNVLIIEYQLFTS